MHYCGIVDHPLWRTPRYYRQIKLEKMQLIINDWVEADLCFKEIVKLLAVLEHLNHKLWLMPF